MTEADARKQTDASLPRTNRTQPVGQEAANATDAAFARAGFRDPTLVLRWDEIVGPEIARLARPIRLSEGASGGVLTLKAEPAASLFLQHETRSLAARINAFLGRTAVARLRFVQGPLQSTARPRAVRTKPAPLPENDPALSYRGGEKLKSALLRLAKTRRCIRMD